MDRTLANLNAGNGEIAAQRGRPGGVGEITDARGPKIQAVIASFRPHTLPPIDSHLPPLPIYAAPRTRQVWVTNIVLDPIRT